MVTSKTKFVGRYKDTLTGLVFYVYRREYPPLGVWEYICKKDKMGPLHHIIYSDEALAKNYIKL